MSIRKSKVVNPPKRIFLCYGDLGQDGPAEDYDHKDAEEVTWCSIKINSTDVEYRLVRPSKHRPRLATHKDGV